MIEVERISACPRCKGRLSWSKDCVQCTACGRAYPIENGIPIFFIPEGDDFKSIEAAVQDEISGSYAKMMQLEAWRNTFYHADFNRELFQLPAGSLVLEIGGGVGSDGLALLRHGLKVVETDISARSVQLARASATQAGVDLANALFWVADGENLPFGAESFDAVVLIAALHHMPHADRCLAEVRRCLVNDGLLVLGMEPNSWYYSTVRPIFKWMEGLLKRLGRRRQKKMNSIAEATTRGFGESTIRRLLGEAGFQLRRLKPTWYLSGVLHYFLEFLFIVLRKRDRISIPQPVEKAIVGIDEVMGRLPVLKKYPWSWNIVASKSRDFQLVSARSSQKGTAE